MEGSRHISYVENIENLKSFIKEDLRKEGIKPPKGKKAKKLNNSSRGPATQDGMLVASGIFGNYLAHVPCEFVNDCGYVPKFLVDAADHIRAHVKTEGIFRKSGSVSRQKELKQQIEEGNNMEISSIYDLTTLIKQFFRELPEPLFTSLYHDCFIKCYQLEKSESVSRGIFSLCLLLPAEHLSTLRFIMQLFFFVASNSDDNKMDATNLSVVLAPNIMHVNSKSEKMNSTEEKLLQIQTAIVELLIKKADSVGMVSEELCKKAAMMTECFGNCTDDELDASDDNTLEDSKNVQKAKKKRKRSGSFQGIVNSIASGLAKLRRSTDGKSINSSQNSTTASNESAQSLSGSLEQTKYPTTTPVVIRKRKASGEVIPFSASKKKAILQHLPQGSALGHTPFTPASAIRRMDINDPSRGMVAGTPLMGDRPQIPFTATPSHSIKTPRKKLNLFSPSSTKKKMARSPSFSNISNGSSKKRKNIFRRLSGSKADKSSASDSSLHIGERLASPPKNSESMDTTCLKRSQSESDSPIAALAQNTTCVADTTTMANMDIRQTLNEGFIGEFQMDLDQTDAGTGLQRSHSLYRPAHASISDPTVSQGKPEGGGHHKRSHSAEIMALKRGQPNTINNGLLKGKHSELRKLRKSFDKSDISAPIPLLVPPVWGCPRSESEQSLVEEQTHTGPPVPPPDPAPNPNSSLMNVILPPPAGFNDTIQQTGYDSDESEAGFSTISGDTVIYMPKQSSSSTSLWSNKSQSSQREKGRLSTQTSRESIKKSLQSSDSSDSLLSSASEMSIENNKSRLERCLSTDSGKGSLFDETIVQPSNDESKDSLDVAFVADESVLMDTTVLQKSCNESVHLETNTQKQLDKTLPQQSSVKKSHSAQQLAHTPKIGVVRSQSMYCHQEARKHNIKPNLLISAETHKILSRAGYYSDQAPQPNGQDFRLPVKSPPRSHFFNLSRRNASLCDQSSLDDFHMCNKSASKKHDLFKTPMSDPSQRPTIERLDTTHSSVNTVPRNLNTQNSKAASPDSLEVPQIKRAEVALPKHESVAEIHSSNAGKVAENVKQFTKVAEKQFLTNCPPKQRGMSPIRIPTIFAKNNDMSAHYRDIAKAALDRGKLGTEERVASKGETTVHSDDIPTGSLPSIFETTETHAEGFFKHPSAISSGRSITVTSELSIMVSSPEDITLEADARSKISFERQNVELSCSLLDTINDVCTPKTQRKNCSSSRSPLKDRGNNIGGRSPSKSVQISDHVVLRTAGGMTPRQVLRFTESSRSKADRSPKKRLSTPGPAQRKSRSPNKLSSVSLPDNGVQSM